MKKLMIIMSATLLLSSCGLYNKYERPEVNTTGLIRDVASDIDTLAVQDTASFGNLPWRQVFTDPQLQALIEQGLEKNADLQNAALTVEMYETMLKAALTLAGYPYEPELKSVKKKPAPEIEGPAYPKRESFGVFLHQKTI
jgi:hypothetical protein